MKYFALFLKLSRIKQISIFVFLVHLFFIVTLSVAHLFHKKIRPHKSISVRVIEEPVFSPQKQSRGKNSAPPPPSFKTKSLQKTSAPPLKPPQKPAAPTLEKNLKKELLTEIQSSLNSFEEPEKITKKSIDVPQKIKLAKNTSFEENAPSYEERIKSFLEASLDLPEYGAVKAEITINEEGRLLNCDILHSQSDKNKKFLKQELLSLYFPKPSDFNIKDPSYSFTITFKNKNS